MKPFTSIKLVKGIGHDRLGLWQNHSCCGWITVDKGTGERILALFKEFAEKIFTEHE